MMARLSAFFCAVHLLEASNHLELHLHLIDYALSDVVVSERVRNLEVCRQNLAVGYDAIDGLSASIIRPFISAR
jgi:hypothetical protein